MSKLTVQLTKPWSCRLPLFHVISRWFVCTAIPSAVGSGLLVMWCPLTLPPPWLVPGVLRGPPLLLELVGLERERERERERESLGVLHPVSHYGYIRERQTDRPTDRHTDRQTEIETDRQTDTRDRDRQTGREFDRSFFLSFPPHKTEGMA